MTGHFAHCLDCDWRAEGDTADREAEKHTKQEKHSTVSGMVNDDALPKTSGDDNE